MTAFSYIQNKVVAQLRPSRISGIGVFALRDIPAGTFLFDKWEGESGYYLITEKELSSLPKALYRHIKDIFLYSPNFPKDTNTYVYLTSGCHWIYTTPYYFMNSNIESYSVDKDTLETIRDVKEGEELLSNYGRYERNKKVLI